MTKDTKQRLNFQVPIIEVSASKDEAKDFIIQGTAINATTTSNNHKFLTEELEASAQTLTGVPLLKDHNNTIDSIMGKVKEGKYTDDKVEFTAIVIDKNAQEMIKDGRLNSVSVGADVSSFDIDENDDSYVPRGIKFRELSFVAVGADEGATFGMALSEAFKLNNKQSEEITMKDKVEVKESAPEMVTMEDVDAAVAKAVTEALAKDAESRKLVEAEKAKEAKEAEAVKVAEEAKMAEETAKKAEEEDETEEVEDEEVEETDSAPYKIEQGSGSLKGGSFSVIRG